MIPYPVAGFIYRIIWVLVNGSDSLALIFTGRGCDELSTYRIRRCV